MARGGGYNLPWIQMAQGARTMAQPAWWGVNALGDFTQNSLAQANLGFQKIMEQGPFLTPTDMAPMDRMARETMGAMNPSAQTAGLAPAMGGAGRAVSGVGSQMKEMRQQQLAQMKQAEAQQKEEMIRQRKGQALEGYLARNPAMADQVAPFVEAGDYDGAWEMLRGAQRGSKSASSRPTFKEGWDDETKQNWLWDISDPRNPTKIMPAKKGVTEQNTGAAEGEGEETVSQPGMVSSLVNDAVSIIDESGWAAAGPIGALAADGEGAANRWMSWTPAGELANLIQPIKSNIAFDTLNRMRSMSKTGGAVGQVSNYEQKMLQSVYGSLDVAQKPEILRRQLIRFNDYYDAIVNPEPGKLGAVIQRWEDGSRFSADVQNQKFGNQFSASEEVALPSDRYLSPSGEGKPQAGGVPSISSDEEYDALPPGPFIDPEGNQRIKP